MPQKNKTGTPDIFDTLEGWTRQPRLAYASWLNSQKLKDSTKTVYLAMFGRFCQWTEEQGLSLLKITPSDIQRFLETPNPHAVAARQPGQTGRQRQQYVRQLERVFAHLGALGYPGGNAGSAAGRARIGEGDDKPTRFLSKAETVAVRTLIEGRCSAFAENSPVAGNWMEWRDLALVAVLLGAGLKVSQIPQISLNCINIEEGFIDLSRPNRAHRAQLQDFVGQPLETWLKVLSRLHDGPLTGSQKIFEADRSMGFGRHSKQAALSASSIHRRTQRLLGEAGITGERACAQTLRNTYAALLIDQGASDAELMDCLGLQAAITTRRLRSALIQFRQKSEPGESSPTLQAPGDNLMNMGPRTPSNP
ncbi:tyrosine-type recombinase/integrase [Zoogloea sp.]|uniref:tyrosine-type recombinase/integrase n=1 Tax=Zoogloea sp. TaxID=49181 RepID=UPI0026184152|nr:tyrosine-type recombinase/integrase [Zoogloea sp.]MDD3352842.1 tyrosine-type recombinase/integrase [Zoogloea sp.]